mmetsp:Transcript_591/g.614  ORF Transcript_591/g.614 Transcript_591/m.614 type:complete len:123 (-) Transcript_591:2-370(-)
MGGRPISGPGMVAGQVMTSNYASGSMVGPGGIVGGAPMVAPAVVNGGGDACGCGPGASAGDCSGACGGMETMCCEPEGGLSSVQWVQASGGSYSPVMSYQYVGEGTGTFEREVVTTYYGWRS